MYLLDFRVMRMSCPKLFLIWCTRGSLQRNWKVTLPFMKFRTSVKSDKCTHERRTMSKQVSFLIGSFHLNKGKALSKVTE